MYEHNALGYWSGLALCLTKVKSSRARCPATALIDDNYWIILLSCHHNICSGCSLVYLPAKAILISTHNICSSFT